MTEPTPDELQERIANFGFTEKEARISLYLEKAEELFDQLSREYEDEDDPGDLLARLIWAETHTHEYFSALHRKLGIRVLSRHYPKGWGYVPPESED